MGKDFHFLGRTTPTGRTTTPLGIMLSRLDKVTRKSNYYMALCPAHADVNPSLGIREDADGNIKIKCFAGCDGKAIVQQVGLELRHLYTQHKKYKG